MGKLPAGVYKDVRDAIRDLSENPRPAGCAKLKDRNGWRIWIGNLRVIYDIEDHKKTATVLRIRH